MPDEFDRALEASPGGPDGDEFTAALGGQTAAPQPTDDADIEAAWGEFAKRDHLTPQELAESRAEYPHTGDSARQYLARVRGEDERNRLKKEAAGRYGEPGFFEKAGQVVSRIPAAAAELAYKVLPKADPTQVGDSRDIHIDPDALVATGLEGVGVISPDERDAAIERGIATRGRMEEGLGWRLANAGAQATGEMAVAGPAFRHFGAGKTMAGMGAASDTENPLRGAAVGLFTGKAGTWAAKYLQGPSGNRLRAALAEGLGFTEADFVAGEATGQSRTAEQSLAAFTTGVGQRLLQANPKATEADFESAIEAQMQAKIAENAGFAKREAARAEAARSRSEATTAADRESMRSDWRAPGEFPDARHSADPVKVPPLGTFRDTRALSDPVEVPGLGVFRDTRSMSDPVEVDLGSFGNRRNLASAEPVDPAPIDEAGQKASRLNLELGAAYLPNPVPAVVAAAKGIGRGAKSAARGAGEVAGEAGKMLRRHFGEVTAALRAHPGGDKMADEMMLARDEGVRFESDIRVPLTETREKTTRKAADWYQGRDFRTSPDGVEWSPSRVDEVVTGKRVAPDAETRAVGDALDSLLREAQSAKSRRGLKGADGETLRVYTGRTHTLPRADTGDFRAIIEAGGDPLKVVARATADLNGRPYEEVLKKFEQQREAMADEGPGAADFRLASEFTRDLRIPGAVKIDGRVVELQETNPRHYADQFAAENSAGVGMDMVFRDPETGKSTINERRKEFALGGKRAKEDFLKAARAAHGLPPAAAQRSRSTALAMLRGGTQKVLGLGRALSQTISPIVNVAESIFGNVADAAGVLKHNPRGAVLAARDAMSRLFGGEHTPKVRDMVERGLKTEDVADWTRDIDNNRASQLLEDASKALNRAIPRHVEEFQETQALGAADSRVDDVGRGKPGSIRREADIQDIRLITKLDRQTVADYLDGKLTPEKANEVFARYMNRFAPVTMGANQTASQKSAFQQHWATKLLIKFSQYPSTNLRYTAERLRLAAEAIRAKNVPEGEKAAARLVGIGKGLKHVGLRAAQGAGSQIAANLVMALFGHGEQMEKDAKEFSANPAKWLGENAAFAVLTGPFAGAARSLWGSGDWEDIIYPVKLAKDLVKPQFKNRDVGTNTMETVERVIPPVGLGTGRANTLERSEREDTGISRHRKRRGR